MRDSDRYWVSWDTTSARTGPGTGWTSASLITTRVVSCWMTGPDPSITGSCHGASGHVIADLICRCVSDVSIARAWPVVPVAVSPAQPPDQVPWTTRWAPVWLVALSPGWIPFIYHSKDASGHDLLDLAPVTMFVSFFLFVWLYLFSAIRPHPLLFRDSCPIEWCHCVILHEHSGVVNGFVIGLCETCKWKNNHFADSWLCFLIYFLTHLELSHKTAIDLPEVKK